MPCAHPHTSLLHAPRPSRSAQGIFHKFVGSKQQIPCAQRGKNASKWTRDVDCDWLRYVCLGLWLAERYNSMHFERASAYAVGAAAASKYLYILWYQPKLAVGGTIAIAPPCAFPLAPQGHLRTHLWLWTISRASRPPFHLWIHAICRWSGNLEYSSALTWVFTEPYICTPNHLCARVCVRGTNNLRRVRPRKYQTRGQASSRELGSRVHVDFWVLGLTSSYSCAIPSHQPGDREHSPCTYNETIYV